MKSKFKVTFNKNKKFRIFFLGIQKKNINKNFPIMMKITRPQKKVFKKFPKKH